MQLLKTKKWVCGPLEVWKRDFLSADRSLTTQWALFMENTLVVVSEDVGEKLSSVMEKTLEYNESFQ